MKKYMHILPLLFHPDGNEGGQIPGTIETTPNDVDLTDESTEEEEEEEENPIFVNPDTGEEEEHQLNEDGDPFLQKEGYKLVLKQFSGASKGLMFYVVEYDDLATAIEMHDEEKILNALNEAMASGIRRKVKSSKIPRFEDKDATTKAIAKLVQNEPIVFTQAEAEDFKPGERELTFNQVMGMIRQAKKDGKSRKEQAELLLKLQDIMDRDAKRAGQFEEDDEDED